MIARVPEEENASQTKQLASHVLTKMYGVLTDSNIEDCPLTMDELLIKAKLSEQQYQDALKVAFKRVHIVMKRLPQAIFINNYNPVILRALRWMYDNIAHVTEQLIYQ